MDVHEFGRVGEEYLAEIVGLYLVFPERLKLFVMLFELQHFFLSLVPGDVPIFLNLQIFSGRKPLLQTTSKETFDTGTHLAFFRQNLLVDQFPLFRVHVFSGFVKDHFAHHPSGLVDQDLCLQIVYLNLLVFSDLVVFDFEGAGHQNVEILAEGHLVEEVGVVIEISNSLKQLEILRIPETNLAIPRAGNELRLGVIKVNLNDFAGVDFVVVGDHHLRHDVIHYDPALNTSDGQVRKLLAETCGDDRHELVFFVDGVNCFMVPNLFEVDWLVEFEEASEEGDYDAAAFIEYDVGNQLDFVVEECGLSEGRRLLERHDLLQEHLPKPFGLRIDDDDLKLSFSTESADQLLADSMDAYVKTSGGERRLDNFV